MDGWECPRHEDFQADELRAICLKLREIREAQGLTQPQVAGLAGISRETLSRWETGAQVPISMSAVVMVARALGHIFELTEEANSLWRLSPEQWRVVEVVEDGDFRTVLYKRVRP